MIDPDAFTASLKSAGITFFTGVPDSLLDEFCACLTASVPAPQHLVSANEGSAIGLAAGHHLATGGVALVYLQNSGLGNAINPLLSLTDPDVYAIPVVLLIGWRGEPGHGDEPQHLKQGRVTPALLDCMEIPYRVLSGDHGDAEAAAWAVSEAIERSGPAALLSRRGVFTRKSVAAVARTNPYHLERADAIATVIERLPQEATVVVATTGRISRELYELRTRKSHAHDADFLVVGSMGHASQIALSIATAKPDRLVLCLDGDGSVLMHMGGLTTIGSVKPANFVHVVLNNGAHESVGGHRTPAFDVDLTAIAKGSGYAWTVGPVVDRKQLSAAMEDLMKSTGPYFLEIRIALGSRSGLGRPREAPCDSKKSFMERLRDA